ncbi:MAG: hypothetical protein ACLPHI_07825 [Terriglobales bacterium]
MYRRGCYDKGIKLLTLIGMLILAQIALGQETAVLRLQQSRASLNIESNTKHGQGLSGVTSGNPGDVWSYPNSASCLIVYNDGKYIIEKRDEPTVGKPKVKSAEGVLAADELQQLKAMLDAEEVKKLTTPKVPDLPSDAQTIREIQTLDLQIDRTGTEQHFTTVQERVMLGGGNSITANVSTGLDTFLDNGAPYKKTLNPLIKWFEGLEKRTKSALKESKPQYCTPINIA